MGMFTRLADIVNANINAMLDKAEDPEKMVRLLVQEMEETLVTVRAEAARHIADKKTLSRQVASFNKQAQVWAHKAETAVMKGRDDLAKAALVEKNKLEDKAEVLAQDLAKVDEVLDALQADVARLQAKLNEAKAKQQSFQKRQQAASIRIQARKNVERLNLDKTFARFEAVERRVENMEAQVEAFDFGKSPDLEQQFRDMEAEGKIDDELAALKAKVAKQPQAVA